MLTCKYSYQTYKKFEPYGLDSEENKNNMYENQRDEFFMFAARLIFSRFFHWRINAKTSTLTPSRQRLREDPQHQACAICLHFRLRLRLRLDLKVSANKC